MANIKGFGDLKNDRPGPPGGGGGMPPGGGGGGFDLGALLGKAGANKVDHKRVKVITDGEFDTEVLKSGAQVVAIDFSANWCGPCRKISPFFAECSEKYTNLKFINIDVDQCPVTAKKCNVSSIPAFHFYQHGKKIDEFVGANPERLRELCEKYNSKSSGGSAAPSSGGFRLGSATESGSSTSANVPTPHPNPTPQQPQHVPNNAPPSSEADPVLLADMVDMGFPSEYAQRALIATQNRGIEQAIEWCSTHPLPEDKPAAAAVPTATPAPSSVPAGTPMAVETPAPTPAQPSTSNPSQPVDSVPPQQSNQMDVDEQAMIETALAMSEEKEKKPLTPDELEEQRKKLQEKIMKLREAKKKDEEEREREREINRIKHGKEALEAKEKLEKIKWERQIALQKKEKEDEMKAKQRIREQIEQDRKERESRKHAPPTAPPSAVPPPATVAPVANSGSGTASYESANIQFRLPDGNTVKASFKPTDPLRTVHNHMALLLGNSRFSLTTNFPKKTYNANDKEMDTVTLQQADCVPTGTFLVKF